MSRNFVHLFFLNFTAPQGFKRDTIWMLEEQERAALDIDGDYINRPTKKKKILAQKQEALPK